MHSITKAIELLTSHGDSILASTSAYNAFFDVIKHNERNILTASLTIKDERGYTINWRDFDLKIKNAKMVLSRNPHNLIGIAWSKEEPHKIATSCTGHNIQLCSDEVHNDFAFNRSFTSVLKIRKERVVIFSSVPKAFNVPALTGSYMISTNDSFNHKFGTISKYHDLVNSPSILNITATTIAYNECEGWLESLKIHITSNI